MVPLPPAFTVTVGTVTVPNVIVPLEPDVVDRLSTLPALPDTVPVVLRLPASLTCNVPPPSVDDATAAVAPLPVTFMLPLPSPVVLIVTGPVSVIANAPLVVTPVSVVEPLAALVNVADPEPVVTFKAVAAVSVVLAV